jgi:hypothetical protein
MQEQNGDLKVFLSLQKLLMFLLAEILKQLLVDEIK